MAHRFQPIAEDSRQCAICGCKDDAMFEGNAIHVWKETDEDGTEKIISLGRKNV